MTNWLTLLRLSYPVWQADLATALRNPSVPKSSSSLLKNLLSLMEYFIPMVLLILLSVLLLLVFAEIQSPYVVGS